MFTARGLIQLKIELYFAIASALLSLIDKHTRFSLNRDIKVVNNINLLKKLTRAVIPIPMFHISTPGQNNDIYRFVLI